MHDATSPSANPRSPRVLPTGFAVLVACALLGTGPLNPARGQITDVGGIARDFTVTDRANGQPIHLTDYAGEVVLLDFFAYWCGPCRASSPDVEVNVNQYFQARGGNAHGVPVRVVPVNIESRDEASTDTFILETGLDFVVNDYAGGAYRQFDTGFIPLFVIINGVADSPSHQQWQVLHRDSGYPGATVFRALINTVEAANATAPAHILQGPSAQTVPAGEPLRLEVRASGSQPLTFQWFRGDQAIAGATATTYQIPAAQVSDTGDYSVEVGNAFGSERSSPVTIRVVPIGQTAVVSSTEVGLTIPDDQATGITSHLTVDNPLEILRLRLSLQITHTYPSDLWIRLRSPAGREVMIYDHGDAASPNLPLNRHELPAFVGENAQGEWTLILVDDVAVDEGRLVSWSLEIVPAAVTFTEAYQQWIQTFPTLPETDRQPEDDPDADGLVNALEYALAGCSPIAPDPRPVLAPAAGDPEILEYVVAWRNGVPTDGCRFVWTAALDGSAWLDVPAEGTDCWMDRTDPAQAVVRMRRSASQGFLRLRLDL